jgi:predicted ABC-type ATPase
MTSTQRRLMIIAGPNGAGKTTFARDFLPREGDFQNYINADLIAEGISPFNPASAAIRAGEAKKKRRPA